MHDPKKMASKLKDNLKNKDSLKNEDDLKNGDDLKNEGAYSDCSLDFEKR